jgi:hypothetical protein
MDIVIRFSEREEAKALPILLRHSQGVALANRTYVLGDLAVEALRGAGVVFRELTGTGSLPANEGVGSGERI